MTDRANSPVLPQRIYLLGFMGSGKSVLGAKLAARLGYDFCDLDALITGREGRSVSIIFAEDGEAYFRKVETETLISTAERNQTLIALGGGTPCFGHNMEWISRNGLSVYLRVPVPTLLGRLKKKRAGRPLLESLDDNALRDYIERTLELRRPFYEQAAVVLDAEGMTPGEVEAALHRHLA